MHSKQQQETWREKCGVFGVYAPDEDVARITFFGLYALQHRGQESAGIATADGSAIHMHSGMGLVSQVFDEDDLGYLPGHIAIGHTRYSTTGSSRNENAQPVRVEGAHGPLALGHNGNLINAELLARRARGRRATSSPAPPTPRSSPRCSHPRPAATGSSAPRTR